MMHIYDIIYPSKKQGLRREYVLTKKAKELQNRDMDQIDKINERIQDLEALGVYHQTVADVILNSSWSNVVRNLNELKRRRNKRNLSQEKIDAIKEGLQQSREWRKDKDFWRRLRRQRIIKRKSSKS